MSHLQKLLDERWPIREDATMADKLTLDSFRMIFTEGYNARVAQEATPDPKKPEYDLAKVLKECRKLISEGKSLTAVRLYKDTMGGSITEAKAILNF